MAHKTNSFERFWKELKRRKVIHVITVYAATAFVILELVNMVARPLQLPDWTEALVIVLLCIGFVIAIFVSWIYDITPAGVKKTKPISELKHSDHAAHAVSSGWKIATYVSGVIIVALVVFNISSDRQRTESEKSIAVLPFRLLSDEPDKQYLADGMMDAITLHLSKIKGLRVIGRTSVEQYRNPTKTTTAIGRELDVEFLLEGSFQKFGDNVRLIVQLIKTGKEGHVWANEYDRNWSDIFTVQSEVAQAVAAELYASITPEEKKLIEKIPTANLTAYDFYQRGREEYWKYFFMNDREGLKKAKNLYKDALKYDSTFAQAYTGLAFVYYDEHHDEEFFKESFLDSVAIFSDIALSYDDQLSDAYTLKAYYYGAKGNIEQAIKELDNAVKFNPNDWFAYSVRGYVYQVISLVKSIENYQKAISLNHGSQLPYLLKSIGDIYLNAGFTEKARNYYQEAFSLDKDSVSYFRYLAGLEINSGDAENGIVFENKTSKLDSTYIPSLEWYSITGKHQEAYTIAKKLIVYYKTSGTLELGKSHRIGYAFYKVGKTNEAEYYFKQQIKYCEESIKLGRGYAKLKWAYYDLAGVYAFLGDKEKAFQYLDEFNTWNFYPLWWVNLARHDPLFDNIRSEERFQKILQNMEAKYQAEHERVRKWLEEQGMLQ
jgi:TolB-like protein